MNASAQPPDGAAAPESGRKGTQQPWRPRTRPTADESLQNSLPRSVGETLRRLLTQARRILGFGVMRASVSLRNLSGEPIRARASLSRAQIEERYEYSQEISLNADVHETKEPAGLIKLTLPYDGEKYFTRQAYRDVVGAARRRQSRR